MLVSKPIRALASTRSQLGVGEPVAILLLLAELLAAVEAHDGTLLFQDAAAYLGSKPQAA